MKRTAGRRGFEPQAQALGMELQAAAYEATRLLEFGGELAQRRVERLSIHLTKTAVAFERAITKLAA